MSRFLDRVALLVTAVLVVVGLWNAPWDSMGHFSGRYVRMLGDKLDPKWSSDCSDTEGLLATMDRASKEILHELEDGGPGSCVPSNSANYTAAWNRNQTCEQRQQRLRDAYGSLQCTAAWRSENK